MALYIYKSFNKEFSKEVLIMTLFEEIVQFLVFLGGAAGDKMAPLKSIMKTNGPNPKNLLMKSLTLI